MLSIGEVNGPGDGRLTIDIGPDNGPREWKTGAVLGGLELGA